MPAGFRMVSLAPAAEKLDPRSEASDTLIDRVIMVRFPDFGWCRGTIVEKNVNRRRAIGGDAVNSIAKFDIDDDTTELSLEAQYYDPSPSADYESWLLLEADGEEVEEGAE